MLAKNIFGGMDCSISRMYYRLRPSKHKHTNTPTYKIVSLSIHFYTKCYAHTMHIFTFVCILWMGVIDNCECDSWQFFPVFYLRQNRHDLKNMVSGELHMDGGSCRYAWCSVLISTEFIIIFANFVYQTHTPLFILRCSSDFHCTKCLFFRSLSLSLPLSL